jgi:glutamine amidotransferase
MSAVIIDYGMGNLASVRRALEECGASVLVIEDPEDLKQADRILLPGVGAFPDGMACLNTRGWVPAIHQAVLQDGIPLLGICLGMQLLMDVGYEGGESPGLKLIPGSVQKMKPAHPEERIPHVGWNEVHLKQPCPLFDGVADKTDFYFVHSYQVKPDCPENVIATTPYCGEVTSSVMRGNVYGAQFHPEKSSKAGFQLLRNFLKL